MRTKEAVAIAKKMVSSFEVSHYKRKSTSYYNNDFPNNPRRGTGISWFFDEHEYAAIKTLLKDK